MNYVILQKNSITIPVDIKKDNAIEEINSLQEQEFVIVCDNLEASSTKQAINKWESKQKLESSQTQSPKPLSLIFSLVLVCFVVQFTLVSLRKYGGFGYFSYSALLWDAIVYSLAGAIVFPLINISIASIWKSKRTSISRRNIFFGWNVFFICTGIIQFFVFFNMMTEKPVTEKPMIEKPVIEKPVIEKFVNEFVIHNSDFKYPLKLDDATTLRGRHLIEEDGIYFVVEDMQINVAREKLAIPYQELGPMMKKELLPLNCKQFKEREKLFKGYSQVGLIQKIFDVNDKFISEVKFHISSC